MMEYLKKNIEWIFSGIGVLIIIWLAGFVKRIILRKKTTVTPHKTALEIPQNLSESQNSSSQQVQTLGEAEKITPMPITRITPISLSEILNAVNSAPPLQQKQVAQNYKGIHVEWNTNLSSAEIEENDSVSLYMRTGERMRDIIHCKVKLSEYRELGILQRGAPIRVIGRIKQVSDLCTELEDVKLVFIQPENGASR